MRQKLLQFLLPHPPKHRNMDTFMRISPVATAVGILLACTQPMTSRTPEQQFATISSDDNDYSLDYDRMHDNDFIPYGMSVMPFYRLTTSEGGQAANNSRHKYSLAITGPINMDDIAALWRASLDSELTVLDLSNAEIEGNEIPAGAFWNEDEQLDTDCRHIKHIKLRRIVLPKNTKRIGAGAFANAVHLEEVIFPDGLESIGDSAFYNCSLRDVILPASCTKLEDGYQFADNRELRRAYLPEGIETLPPGIFSKCINLREIAIPSTVKHISAYALNECRALGQLTLPPHLETISERSLFALDYLKELSFPASLRLIDISACCYLTELQNIYCEAPEPPLCKNIDDDSSHTPFGQRWSNCHYKTWENATLYVPIGTADAYKKAPGWEYFRFIYETDNFPEASVDKTELDKPGDNDTIYDLEGRVVSNPSPGHLYVKKGEKFIYRK